MPNQNPAKPASIAPKILHYLSDKTCVLCGRTELEYLFVSHGAPVYQCTNCKLVGFQPQPNQEAILKYYAATTRHNPFAFDDKSPIAQTEIEAAHAYLELMRKQKFSKEDLLVVVPKGHPFPALARENGYRLAKVLDIYELEKSELSEGSFQGAIVILQLERASNPVKVLEKIHNSLTKDANLLLVTASLDSWSAHFFRGQWTAWRPENYYYFNSHTIQAALLRSGFAGVKIKQDRRQYSLSHLYERARAYPRTPLTRTVRLGYRLLPKSTADTIRVGLPASCVVVTAKRGELRPRPLLSIILPAYNEQATFAYTMEALLEKEVPGFDKEIIVVESNSKDGTRETALQYRDYPGVRLILEDKPRGKGHAVRAGLKQAQGDIILIQDADREYDINDYDSLVEPLRTYRKAFVLGSRHSGDWKMRTFNDQPGISAYYNFGHLLFTTLVNVLYRQRLKDPFTMYKVFWRDCLSDVKLECNRFDFDHELLIKLLRKGYLPEEIPVNYQSRSFKEGKKVSTFRDPFTWIVALLKYRFVSIYEDEETRNES